MPPVAWPAVSQTEARITAITDSSPAASAGLEVGDEILALNGHPPRDVIEYAQLSDEPELEVQVRRRGTDEPVPVRIQKHAGEPVGIEVASAVFDRVRTCDNHCAFCFIHQLPKGLRKSLYVKDDDYRLSFLYGNFTTLTRFTELDAERVIQERLSPLYVSIHATDPHVRGRMLRNPRGATSLRWLRVLLAAGIEVHGQIVVCPGINDGAVLEDTMATILDVYPELASVGLVPLGISRYTREAELRPHSADEAHAVCEVVSEWQSIFLEMLGRRVAYAADEYYLLSGGSFPAATDYEDFAQHENGVGMVAAFTQAFRGDIGSAMGVRSGFFASVDGAPAAGYRANRYGDEELSASTAATAVVASAQAETVAPRAVAVTSRTAELSREQPIRVLTGVYGARVLSPLVDELVARGSCMTGDVRVMAVDNRFFGGNIGVAGLLTGSDIGRVMHADPPGIRYLLPDACLSNGRFLDGTSLDQLPRPVEVIPSDGWSLRRALTAPGTSEIGGVPNSTRASSPCGSGCA